MLVAFNVGLVKILLKFNKEITLNAVKQGVLTKVVYANIAYVF